MESVNDRPKVGRANARDESSIVGVRSDPTLLPTVLRSALGLIFIIGGIKLAFPSDPGALAASYVDPQSGWISPYFAEQITDRIGIQIQSFLRIQGLVEIALGSLLILGLFTPIVAVLAGLMFWSFTVANPVAGEIRLSRDIALAGLAFALAAAGAGRWSVDEAVRHATLWVEQRRHAVLVVVRLSLAFTLLASALFSGGVMGNHLNSTVPWIVPAALGLGLAAGIAPRWMMAAVILWMLYLVSANLLTHGLFAGLDSTKREIGLLAGALVYFAGGTDRWAWPRRRRARSPKERARSIP